MAVPKILVIPGSLRAKSYNVRLAALATKELMLADADVTRISLRGLSAADLRCRQRRDRRAAAECAQAQAIDVRASGRVHRQSRTQRLDYAADQEHDRL